MKNDNYLSYKYHEDQSKLNMLRKRFLPKPPHQELSEYDDWLTGDPFTTTNFFTYPGAPYTRKELFNF
jgi:hypothetical protein